jgi:hypothetical protein
MKFQRIFSIPAVAFAGALFAAQTATAQTELVFGNWTPPREYQNTQVMPYVFEQIAKETNGAVKWKLIAGGQLADGKTTFTAIKDNLMQGGLAIATYVPNLVPSLGAIYTTVILGHNDVVAATGAALETFYLNCPSCLEEFRALNSVPLSGWTSSCRSEPPWSRQLACSSAAASTASTASPTGFARLATPTSRSTSSTIRSAYPGRRSAGC